MNHVKPEQPQSSFDDTDAPLEIGAMFAEMHDEALAAADRMAEQIINYPRYSVVTNDEREHDPSAPAWAIHDHEAFEAVTWGDDRGELLSRAESWNLAEVAGSGPGEAEDVELDPSEEDVVNEQGRVAPAEAAGDPIVPRSLWKITSAAERNEHYARTAWPADRPAHALIARVLRYVEALGRATGAQSVEELLDRAEGLAWAESGEIIRRPGHSTRHRFYRSLLAPLSDPGRIVPADCRLDLAAGLPEGRGE